MTHHPLDIFTTWYEAAVALNQFDASACALATANKEAIPSLRMVLLKSYSEQGFVFYTNLNSHKGSELAENPHAALCFYWPQMHKQIRLQGKIIRVSDEEADAYFATRPRASQIGAWASKQSQVMQDKNELQSRYEYFTEKFSGIDVPRPLFWSGFALVPNKFEFWQQGENRLHNRVCYRDVDGVWIKEYLYP